MGMLVNPYRGGSIPNAVFELDAGLIGSFTGGGSTNWMNVVASPADSSSQSSYDFTKTGPTFNGSAGANSASEYFSSDGGDYFLLTGSNTTFVNSLHKDNAVFTWYGFLRLGTSDITEVGLFGTQSALSGIGISITLNSGGNAVFTQGSGSANTIKTTSTFPAAVTTSAFVALSYTESTGVGLFYWNGASKVTESFTQAYTSPSSSAASSKPTVLGAGENFYLSSSGTRIWRTGMFNLALSEAQLDALFNLYKSKLGF